MFRSKYGLIRGKGQFIYDAYNATSENILSVLDSKADWLYEIKETATLI